MPKPGDLSAPGLTPGGCSLGEDEPEYALQNGRLPRATAMGNFARAEGCPWQSVTCRRGWIRLWTRQESWDYDPQARLDAFIEGWAHRLDLDLNKNDQWVDREGNVYDEPKMPDVVPDDWEPGDDDPVWSFCGPGDPGALPAWWCEGPVG